MLSALCRSGSSLLLDQSVQHGQQEGSGLARAGLARHHQIGEMIGIFAFTVHGQGNGTLLHCGRLGVSQVLDGLHQLRRQTQLDEAVGLIGLCFYGFRFGGISGIGGFHVFDVIFSVGKVLGRRGFALQMDILRHFEK
ncbi:hypothetical protein D3C72_1419490 [compost metagenome]